MGAQHIVHRRVRWFIVAVCPWWLTCCRDSSRRPTPSRRAYWSCWTGSPSTAALQRRRSLTSLQVCIQPPLVSDRQHICVTRCLSTYIKYIVICSIMWCMEEVCE